MIKTNIYILILRYSVIKEFIIICPDLQNIEVGFNSIIGLIF